MTQIHVHSSSFSVEETEGEERYTDDSSDVFRPGGGAGGGSSATIQMQGFADSRSGSASAAASADGQFDTYKVGSLHSEPDIDIIMPLPESPPRPPLSGHQGYFAVGPSGGGVRGEEEEEEEDGPHSMRQRLLRENSDFTTIEHPMLSSGIFGDDLTAKALKSCKKTVLRPYFIFLKLIGWRQFRPIRLDLEPPLWLKILNVLWPIGICILIIVSCVTQTLTCFQRTMSPLKPVHNSTSNETYYDITCTKHMITSFVIPQILLLCAFVYGLYIFRRAQTEHLSTLTEAVFLCNITKLGRYSHRRLTFTLQLIMVLGFLWILFSLGANVFRVFSLHLLERSTIIEWIPNITDGSEGSNLTVRVVLVVISVLGLIVLDFAYVAVVINYSFQCQLIIYLLHNICSHMKTKEWEIEQTIKEIKNAREYLSQLNSHLARAMSILLFIFLTSCVEAFYGLKLISKDNDDFVEDVATGVLSVIQWTTILALPLIQAARVSRACMKLKKTSLEVRSRPYSYKETAQLDLDSLVTYTTGLSMSAKLISIPVYPGVTAGAFFLAGFLLFLFLQYDTYSWARWM